MKLLRETEKKEKNTKLIYIIAAAVAVLCLAVLGWRLSRGGNKPGTAPSAEPTPTPTASAPAAQAESRLETAKKVNPDVVAWLTVDGAAIDDPIVQAADNDFYLRRKWDVEGYDVWGCYFLDYINVVDSSSLHDRVSIIYGHALDDYTDSEKFSKLKNYRNADFCKQHPTFTLELEGKTLTFEVFAAVDIPISIDYIDPNPDDAKLQSTLDYMLANSYQNFGVKATISDKILLLSTCTSDENTRYVVAARQK